MNALIIILPIYGFGVAILALIGLLDVIMSDSAKGKAVGARIILAAPAWPLVAVAALPFAVRHLIRLAATPGNPKEVQK